MISYKPLSLYFSYNWKDLRLSSKLLLNLLPLKLFLQKWNIPTELETKYLFTQSMDRKDYNEFIDIIFNSIESDDKHHILIKKDIKLNFDSLSLSVNEVKKIWKDIESSSFFEKIFIFLNIIQVAAIQKQLQDYDIDILTTHADMQPVENYIVQYFKSKNIKTVTLQHGLYIEYKKYLNINEVNYMNVVSDYFLAWGNETKELIQKYHPECKVVVCGNPMVKEIIYKPRGFFTIVFDYNKMKQYNQKLIKIGRKVNTLLGIEMRIKLHPNDKASNYNLKNEELIDENLENSRFVIGHVTSMIYILDRYNIPVFKLLSDEPKNKLKHINLFQNERDIINKVKDCFDNKKINKYYIQDIDFNSQQNYIKFYKELT